MTNINHKPFIFQFRIRDPTGNVGRIRIKIVQVAVIVKEIAIVIAVIEIVVIADDVTVAVKVGVEVRRLINALRSARKETGVKAKARRINWFSMISFHSTLPLLVSLRNWPIFQINTFFVYRFFFLG